MKKIYKKALKSSMQFALQNSKKQKGKSPEILCSGLFNSKIFSLVKNIVTSNCTRL